MSGMSGISPAAPDPVVKVPPPPQSLFFCPLLHTSLSLPCCVHCGNLICVAGVPGGQHRAVQPFSDEDASVETLSHCSSFSDAASVAEEGGRALCVINPDTGFDLPGWYDVQHNASRIKMLEP